MNIEQLNLIKDRHEQTFMSILDIISKYIDYIPAEMIDELQRYDMSISYPIEQCIDGQLKR